MAATGKVPTIAETVELGPRVVLAGSPDMELVGEACHRFFAADEVGLGPDARLQLAGDILRRWGVPQLAPDDLVTLSDRLRTFIDARYGEAEQRREWPVHALVDGQIISGRIDLLIDAPAGLAILDHKSFPGDFDLGGDRLASFAAQVGLYADALKAATDRDCGEFWIHQPLAGRALRVVIEG